jgi:Septum formation
MHHRRPATLFALALLVAACASPGASVSPEESAAASQSPEESAAGASEAAAGEMVSVFDLEVGQCFNQTEETIVEEVEVIDCESLHDYEIYGVANHPAADGEPWVGEGEMESFVKTECVERFEPFVGMDYESSTLYIYYLAPTEDTWGEGDREVICSLYLPDEQLEGSMEGSGV